jgi:hypothetical protein
LNARWSIVPSLGSSQRQLTLIGQRGKAVLTIPDRLLEGKVGDWSLDIACDEFSTQAFAADDELPRVFAELAGAVQEPTTGESAWLAACRDQEATEAIDRSLIRGRTIELYHEEHTEAASFKGIMAMGGCLLLVLALCFLLLVTVVEGLRLPVRNLPAWRAWPLYVLIPIGAFLLLQLLGFVAKQRQPAIDGGSSEPSNGANSAG